MTSQPGYQTITIHTLHNILQKKDNQTKNFGFSVKGMEIVSQPRFVNNFSRKMLSVICFMLYSIN